jgi:hypothetical protein
MTPSANRGAASVLEKREQDEALAGSRALFGGRNRLDGRDVTRISPE